MSRWLHTLLALTLLAVGTPAVLANPIAPPVKPQPGTPAVGNAGTELTVMVDPNAKWPRMLIPQKLLGGQAPPRKGADAGGRLPLLVGGLALTAAFVSGGFWLVRRGRGRFLTGACLVLFLAVGSSAFLFADVPSPKPNTRPHAVTLPAGVMLPGKVSLEIVDKGEGVTLIIPQELLIKGGK
jgi:hypothetical protein